MSALFDLQGRYMRDMTESDRLEIRMYGTTVDQMRESIESTSTFKFSGPAMIVAGMMSDAQEMMSYGEPDFRTIEDQRQLLNRAKFVLMTYIMDRENG